MQMHVAEWAPVQQHYEVHQTDYKAEMSSHSGQQLINKESMSLVVFTPRPQEMILELLQNDLCSSL